MKWHQSRQWNGRDRAPLQQERGRPCGWAAGGAASPPAASNEPLAFGTKSGSQGLLWADQPIKELFTISHRKGLPPITRSTREGLSKRGASDINSEPLQDISHRSSLATTTTLCRDPWVGSPSLSGSFFFSVFLGKKPNVQPLPRQESLSRVARYRVALIVPARVRADLALAGARAPSVCSGPVTPECLGDCSPAIPQPCVVGRDRAMTVDSVVCL